MIGGSLNARLAAAAEMAWAASGRLSATVDTRIVREPARA